MRIIAFYLMLIVGFICFSSSQLGAQQIAYDGFAYPAGPLIGDGPGFGFAAPWTTDGGINVVAPGLSSPLDQPSTGNAVSGAFNYWASLNNLLPNMEFWASFLLYNAGGNDQTYMGLNPTLGPGIPYVAFGVKLTQYGIFNNSTFIPAPSTPWSGVGATDFLLADFLPVGPDWQVFLYVNPTSLAIPSAIAIIPIAPITEVLNQNQVGFVSDEVRIGLTPFDAGFVPEPQPLTIIAAALFLMQRGKKSAQKH
ncbi:MAG TPA: hypothetical protein VGG19_11085 [Tepidisphaeraceae bacterium]|jgi:hypothetical protein